MTIERGIGDYINIPLHTNTEWNEPRLMSRRFG
jgi:hypothetical protein